MKFALKLLLLTLIFILPWENICSQNQTFITKGETGELSVINPSTSEFIKYGSTPVSQYNGKLDLNIPMYSLSFDGLNIPINLNYNSSGIRTNQEATWVGLGWSMNVAPSITHIINQESDIGAGRPEQPRFYGYCFEPAVPSFLTSSSPYINILNDPNSQNNSTFYDTQPDIFIANLPTGSVKFMLTQESVTGTIQAKILNNSNAIIDYDKDSKHFAITDDSGFTYYFDQIEYSSSFSRSYSSTALPLDTDLDQINGNQGSNGFLSYNDRNRDIPTTWFASKIISPNHKELDLIYYGQEENLKYAVSSHTRNNASYIKTVCMSGAVDYLEFQDQLELSASRSVFTQKKLKEIINTSTGERILFKASKRDDLFAYDPNNIGIVLGISFSEARAPLKLDEIQVFAPTGKIVKDIKLNTSYFNSYSSSESFLRLKLDAINVDGDLYTFDYFSPDGLPNKNTKDADFWGFYNGAGNTKRYPTFQSSNYYCGLTDTYMSVDIPGGLRGSNFEEGKTGTLSKMTYPTGGYSMFDYESNTALVKSSLVSDSADQLLYYYLSENNIEQGYPVESPNNSEEFTFKVGGLRIKSVNNFDSNDDLLLKKSYFYESVGSTSLGGRLMDKLYYFGDSYVAKNAGLQTEVQRLDVIASSTNKVRLSNVAMGSHVGYDKVTEVVDNVINASVQNGKIETSFINTPMPSLLNTTTGVVGVTTDLPPLNYEDANGLVTEQVIFSSNGMFIKKVTNDYELYKSSLANGHKVYFITHSGSFYGKSGTSNHVIDWFSYPIYKFIPKLISSTTIDYTSPGNSVETLTNSSYNSKHQLSSRTTRLLNSSLEDYNKIEYYYPYDTFNGLDAFPSVSSLMTKNRIKAPIYTRSYRGSRLTGHKLDTYSFYNGLLLMSGQKWQKKESSLLGIEPRVTFDDYDSYGNPLRVSLFNGTSTSYVWGYENMYPIAQIKNSTQTPEQIDQKIDTYVVNNPNTSDTDIEAQINLLRIDPDFSSSLITSNTFSPAVGVSSTKNEFGYKSTFEFDDRERLIKARDQDNNIISEAIYNKPFGSNDCVDCGRKIIVQPSNYLTYTNTLVSIGRQILNGSNGENFNGYSNYIIHFGDGEVQSGTGGVPSTFSHTYQESGLMTIRLFVSNAQGNFESGQSNVQVTSNSMPGGDVYFGDINTNVPDGSSTARIYGDPGAVITYKLKCVGQNDNMFGYGQVGSTYIGDNLPSQSATVGTYTIPPSGYIDCSVKFNPNTNPNGSAYITIMDTTIGQIVTPNTFVDYE